MKKTVCFFVFLGAAMTLNAAEQGKIILGNVEKIEGSAYYLEVGSEKKMFLTAGQFVYEGIIIITEKNGKVLVRLNNGILKYIPAESKFSLINKKYLEIYKQTDDSAKKLTATLGIKAAENSLWIEDEPMLLKSLRKTFGRQNYLETVQRLEEYSLPLKMPETQLIAAISYFKLGNEEKSAQHYSLLIAGKQQEYQERAYFGLFLNYIRQQKIKQAKEIYQWFEKNEADSLYFKDMKLLLERYGNI